MAATVSGRVEDEDLLSASPLPEYVQSKLRLGSKFGFEPPLKPVEKVVMAGTVSGRVEDDMRQGVLVAVTDKLMKVVKGRAKRNLSGDPSEKKKQFAVIPYTHRIAHGLKNVGPRC
ncbi:hypothetical protein HPB48_011993 [Haemaphysalis longicornis]|uniref:Uncharacterized protein n=1 Tax=Haemaphysalis longicornis TaxID=44386 RepID=A0A9J6H6U0_HAELO|nr:hypothetical protein HPB48_011993 [Haemaphysalis longicornis]